MNKNRHKLLLFLILTPVFASGITLSPVGLDTIKDTVMPLGSSNIKFFIGEDSAQKKDMLDRLKVEYKSFLEKTKLSSESIDKQVDNVKKEIDQIKSIASNNNDDFLSKKLDLLNKKYQILPDIREAHQQIIEYMKQHIEYLDQYFLSVNKDERIEEKSLYAFSDLQILTHRIMLEKEALSRLVLKKESEELIVTRTEGFIASKDKEIKAINEYIDVLKKSQDDVKNQLIIADLEKEVLLQERELDSLRLEEHALHVEFINSQMFVTTYDKNSLEANLVSMRNRMKVDKQDVIEYQHENDRVKKIVQASKIDLMKKRTDLADQKKHMQEEVDKLSNRYKISLSNIRQVEDWEIPVDSIHDGFAGFSVSLALEKVAVVDQMIEEVRVETLKQDAILESAQSLEDAVQSLYAITQSKFRDNDHLEILRAHYKELKVSIQNTIKLYQDRTIELHSFIKSQYKKIQNIKKYQEHFKSYSPNEVAANQKKYNDSLALLTKALKSIDQQGDLSLRLSEQYAVLIEKKESSLALANFMLQELDLIGLWHRSNRAVTWHGIKEIIPNLITFTYNIYGLLEEYIIKFHFLDDAYNFVTQSTSQFILYILLSILLYFLYVFLLAMLPLLNNALINVPQDMQGVFLLSRIIAVMSGFLQKTLGPIFGWSLLFGLLNFHQFSIVFTLAFYVGSILFLIYTSRSFLLYLLKFNRSNDFLLLGKSFEDRFQWIFSFFSISTILILFFRKMFMLVMVYQQSEFPIILLRLYHVVIFISVVFSIEKEELLNIIPKTNIYFDEISNLINRYYYLLSLFCIILLILSDPYLGGYGHLMWYVIFNSTISVILLGSMYFVHNAIKSMSSWMFFKENGEFGSKERFNYAKTWYAMFVISFFFVSIVLATYFIAKIWGYPVEIFQFKRFLNYPIYYGAAGSKLEFIRVAGCIRLLLSPFIGVFIAYLFRNYVLQRVFTIQYVDPGMQDTIMTISRYIIIISTIFIILEREGLGFIVGYILGIGLVTFGWTFKDLFSDVVAYFFILVQRPIKVGDLIQLEDRVLGVVKKIGPRSVIIRRKNSVTIIVPNSKILNSSIYNWNYTRGFIAFDDIVFTVPFASDLVEVKSILYTILDDNPDVLKVPEPLIRVDDFSDHGYVFMVRGFISSHNTLEQWTISSDIRMTIASRLKAKGIQVAEYTMNVKMK